MTDIAKEIKKEMEDVEMKLESEPDIAAATEKDTNSDDEKMKDVDNNDNEDEGDDSSEDGVEPSEPLATTRSRRANAGNRMSKLILEEEEDEFYTKNYGGFMEEEDDDDFDEEEEVDDEEVEEDYDVDSDFDIDETDEIAPEHQAVDEEPRKRKVGYKEPKRKVQQGFITGSVPASSTPIQTAKAPKASSSATPHSPSKHRPERSFRASTTKKTEETIKNYESGKKKKKRPRNMEPNRTYTQEELLEEAKVTEEANIKSLEIYQRLESEKLKKIKLVKKGIPPPYMTYYSSVFTNPETKEGYSRNLCTFVGCDIKLYSSTSDS